MNKVKLAFQTLMGIVGDKYVKEIEETNKLSQKSYNEICDNVKYNSQDSIINHFGVIQYYYFQSLYIENKSFITNI